MSSQTVRFPELQTHSIYAGKFKDYFPSVKAAGKLTSSGDTAQQCLKPVDNRPPSPEIIRRFRNTFYPDAGKPRIFYGKAYDPHLKWATEMRHGVSTHPSLLAGDLVNPYPKTNFQQHVIDRKEENYGSHVRAPLGVSYDQTPGLPPNLDPLQFTFGNPTVFSEECGVLVNPRKNYAEVEAETNEFHDKYVFSHQDYFPGEKLTRSYTMPEFNPKSTFGKPTPHDNDGRQTRKTLKWAFNSQLEKGAKLESKRLEDFRERYQHQIGLPLDPIKDTMKVGPSHVFGLLFKPDEYSVGDLVHNRVPGTYLRGRDRQRGLIAAMRQHLKNMNYQMFPDLIRAFNFYDKEGKGKIDINDLREACEKFSLPVDIWLLEQVFDYCDVNRDGQIDYHEFANFLNWKNKLPPEYVRKDSKETSAQNTNGFQIDLNCTADSKSRTCQSADPTPRRLQKQIDRVIADPHTSSNMINAVVGPGGIDTRNYRKYGIPTIRSDLPPPRIRKLDDYINYGDESHAYALLNPSIYNTRGVYEKDLLTPRTLDELKEIFTNIGVKMTGETFEELYKQVASLHPKGHVSVESFRNALDEIVHSQVLSSQHLLAF